MPPDPPIPPSARSRSIPGYLTSLSGAAIVMALPLLAHVIDGSADEFSPSRFRVLPAIGWLLCAALTAVVVTRSLQTAISIEEASWLAVAYDALPLLLSIAWVIGILAAVTGHWLLMVAAAGLCCVHLILVVPRLVASRRPSWTKHAPRLRVGVANVFVDNPTPDQASRQMVSVAPDVLVIVEATRDFMQVFDECGGADAFPHRVVDPDDQSDYAVAVVSQRPLGPRSEFRRLGPLRLAIADVDVDGVSTLVVALNPMSLFDEGGHLAWKEQISALEEFLPALEGPVVIAGDLNTTRFRPEFDQVLALGYTDAIDSLGKGLSRSFKLSNRGVLGAVGAVVRLDHALVTAHMHAMSLRNLDPCGSDHVPFVIDLAVRASTPVRHVRWRRSAEGRPTDGQPTGQVSSTS